MKNHTLKQIWQSGWAFESAIVDTLVLFVAKPAAPKDSELIIGVDEIQYSRKISEFLDSKLYKIDYRIQNESKEILRKVLLNSKTLKEIATVRAGVKLYEKGKGQPPQTEETMSKRPFSKKAQCPHGWRALYRGTDVGRYQLHKQKEFVSYGPWLAAPRTSETFDSPKIIMRRTDDRLLAAIEFDHAICVNSCHVIKLKDPSAKTGDYLFILGLINSRLMQYIFELQNPQMIGKVFAEIKVVYVERLPIVTVTPQEQKTIEVLVQRILQVKQANPNADVADLERKIDARIYRLYGLNADDIAVIEGTGPAASEAEIPS